MQGGLMIFRPQTFRWSAGLWPSSFRILPSSGPPCSVWFICERDSACVPRAGDYSRHMADSLLAIDHLGVDFPEVICLSPSSREIAETAAVPKGITCHRVHTHRLR